MTAGIEKFPIHRFEVDDLDRNRLRSVRRFETAIGAASQRSVCVTATGRPANSAQECSSAIRNRRGCSNRKSADDRLLHSLDRRRLSICHKRISEACSNEQNGQSGQHCISHSTLRADGRQHWSSGEVDFQNWNYFVARPIFRSSPQVPACAISVSNRSNCTGSSMASNAF